MRLLPIPFSSPRPFRDPAHKLEILMQGRLWLQVLCGLLLGFITGYLLGPEAALVERGSAAVIGEWLALPGQLFLRLIRMILIPLLVASSIGAPAAPGVGMAVLGSIAGSFGIPLQGLALVMGVDRLLDTCRTALNITGNLTACTVLSPPKTNWFTFWKKPS